MRPILILAFSLVAATNPTTAYPFDNGRFLPETDQKTARSTYALPIVGARGPEDFVLGPNGSIPRAIEPLNLNTDSSGFDGASTPASTVVDDSKLNTLYSLTGASGTVPECGQSAFQPAQIEAFVTAAAERHGVDPAFATAIAWIESRFDQVRNSHKGARGPMQLMPGTAQDLGVRDSCDSLANIDGGVRHLKALIAEFRNPVLAAAAYNAGAQAVYDNSGVPPYPETVRYVATVLNRQLGIVLPTPKRPGKADMVVEQTSSPNDQISINQASDVLAAKGGWFVNGVMHF